MGCLKQTVAGILTGKRMTFDRFSGDRFSNIQIVSVEKKRKPPFKNSTKTSMNNSKNKKGKRT
jgi:hypothetical protein